MKSLLLLLTLLVFTSCTTTLNFKYGDLVCIDGGFYSGESGMVTDYSRFSGRFTVWSETLDYLHNVQAMHLIPTDDLLNCKK